MVSGDYNVCAKSNFETATTANAVDGADDGLVEVFELLNAAETANAVVAVDFFAAWVRLGQHQVGTLTQLDATLTRYINHLYFLGEGKGKASTALAAIAWQEGLRKKTRP